MAGPSPKRVFAFLPLTIHLETVGGIATPLVLRGTPLPAERTEVFSTAADEQVSVEIKVYMGESPLTENNLYVGTVRAAGIPPAKRGVPQIRVSYSVDRTCTINVRTTIDGTEIKVEQKLNPENLDDELIARLLRQAEDRKDTDEGKLRNLEAINRANSLIAQAQERLRRANDAQLNSAVAALGLALQSGDADDIRSKADVLSSLITPSFDPSLFNFDFGAFRASQKKSSTKTAAPPESKKPISLAQAVKTRSPEFVLGKVFGGGEFTLDPQLCFVLMPFASSFQPIYDDHIRPVVESAGLKCQRVDEVAGTNSITWDIWERVNRARLLIAELTGQNPNVFYELGLAHAISKDVILVTQSMDHVPFDLRTLRCVVYEYNPRSVRVFETKLRATIDAVMRGA